MNPIASQGSKLMVSNGTNNVDILPTFYIQLYQLPGTKFTARDLRFAMGRNRSWKRTSKSLCGAELYGICI
jgi:hypothetical protein